MRPNFNILLADDHVMFRRGLRSIIQDMVDISVVGEASDGFEVLELLKKITPQLVILDISMPNLRGLETIREIKTLNRDIKVLILTMHRDEDYLEHALSAGAEGYLLKEDAESELLAAIEALRKGGTYISPLLSTQLADIFIQRSRPTKKQPEDSQKPLTTRECEIIKLAAEGKSSKEIADLLFISSRTVQHHRANIMRKLNFKKAAEMIRYAIYKGYAAPNN